VSFEPIVKFYVSAYAAEQGTTFNYASRSVDAGNIDFSSVAAQGKFGAFVTQDETGKFTTLYLSRVAFTEMVAASKQMALSGNPLTDVILIKSQV